MEWLNHHKIAQLSQDIGAENLLLILEVFLRELESYQKNLTHVDREESFAYLAEVGHALKSSAASFGADRLCAKASDIDHRIKQGLSLDVERETRSLLDTVHQTLEHYTRLMG